MNFLQNFVNARNVGTPIVKVNTPDNMSTVAAVRKSLGKAEAETPTAIWDSLNGLKGLNDAGTKTIMQMIQSAGIEKDATTNLPITLQVVNNPEHENFILFVQNPHLFWSDDPLVIQGIWNCRDPYKANGMMLILLTPLGTLSPPDLNNDVLSLEEALPTRPEIRKLATDIYTQANAKIPNDKIFEQIGDALVGIPAFPADQALDTGAVLLRRRIDVGGHGGQ